MASKIEWTDVTWNPITGCSPVSPGCKNCYAERMAKRLVGRFGYPADDPFRVTLHEDKLDEPLRWRKPRKVFVCSMGDLFHEDVPDEWLAAIWHTMSTSPWHIFLVLTKRPERMYRWVAGRIADGTTWREGLTRCPLSNVWLGVSAETQKRADERIPVLLDTPAAKRFVSVEPMLGPVDLRQVFSKRAPGLDWVICGGETGPGYRPMQYGWAFDLRLQCANANVPFFFKKMAGGAPPRSGLMVREWPV